MGRCRPEASFQHPPRCGRMAGTSAGQGGPRSSRSSPRPPPPHPPPTHPPETQAPRMAGTSAGLSWRSASGTWASPAWNTAWRREERGERTGAPSASCGCGPAGAGSDSHCRLGPLSLLMDGEGTATVPMPPSPLTPQTSPMKRSMRGTSAARSCRTQRLCGRGEAGMLGTASRNSPTARDCKRSKFASPPACVPALA